jgi:hypothetical protein
MLVNWTLVNAIVILRRILRREPGVAVSSRGRVKKSAGSKALKCIRICAVLEIAWLAEQLDIKIAERDLMRLRRMDNAAMIKDIYNIAKKAAERQVKPEYWLTRMS